MTLLQKLYMIVLNTLFKLTGKLSDKVRKVLLVLTIAGIEFVALFFNYWGKLGSSFGYRELFLVNTPLLCLAVLFSVKEELKPVKWRMSLMTGWILCGLIIMLPLPDMAGRGTFIMFGGMMAFIFPAFYFVWNNRGDYQSLYKSAAIATVLTTLVFFVKCFLEAPIVLGAAYEGITDNSNTIGIASIGGAIAALALIAAEDGKLKYLYMILFGFFISFTWISGSRASLLAILLAGVAFAIVLIRKNASFGPKGIFKSFADLLIIAIVAALMLTGIKAVMTRDEPIVHNAKLEAAVERELEAEAKARKESLEAGIISEYTYNRLNEIANGTYDPDKYAEGEGDITDKFTKGDGKVENLSSGRMSTWRYYYHHLGIMGHSRANGDPYIKERGLTAAAHNTYLEISYRSGIIAGLLYAAIAVFAAFWCFKYLFGRKGKFNPELCLVVLAVFAFGIMSHLERAVYPVEKVHILLYFLTIAPIFDKEETTF